MKSRIATALLLAAVLLCGCANDYKKVSVTSCKMLNDVDFALRQGNMHTALSLEFTVDNPTSSKFEIADASALVYDKNGTEFGRVTLREAFQVKPKVQEPVVVGIDIAVFDPMALLFGGNLSLDGKIADITVKIKQNGIGPKTIEFKKVSLQALVKRFNLTVL